MVDVADSKSADGDIVWVRVPPPAPRQKNSAPFRFLGLRKSRENCTSAESFFLSETEVSWGTSVSVMENGSDLDCSGAPRQNKAARSYGGTSTAILTGDLVFPFQPRPADAGLASDCGAGSDSDSSGASKRRESCWGVLRKEAVLRRQSPAQKDIKPS